MLTSNYLDKRACAAVKPLRALSVPVLCGIFALLSIFPVQARDTAELFKQGVEALQWQRNEEAVNFLFRASEATPGNDTYLLYLGMSYRAVGRLEDSRNVFDRGIALNGPRLNELLLSRGNLRAASDDTDGAMEDYTRLIGNGGGQAASATLNRANLETRSGQYSDALTDYKRYLVLDPETSQKDSVERLIALLSAQVEAEREEARLAEEQRRREEQVRREEEARREALMNSLLESLSGSGDETKNIGAGSENIEKEFEDSELED